jgi:hypothetical protein
VQLGGGRGGVGTGGARHVSKLFRRFGNRSLACRCDPGP